MVDAESFGRTFGFPLSVAFGHLNLGLQNSALDLSLHALLKLVLDLLNDNLSVFDLLLWSLDDLVEGVGPGYKSAHY